MSVSECLCVCVFHSTRSLGWFSEKNSWNNFLQYGWKQSACTVVGTSLSQFRPLDHTELGKQWSRKSNALPNLTIICSLSECRVLRLSRDGVRSAEGPVEGKKTKSRRHCKRSRDWLTARENHIPYTWEGVGAPEQGALSHLKGFRQEHNSNRASSKNSSGIARGAPSCCKKETQNTMAYRRWTFISLSLVHVGGWFRSMSSFRTQVPSLSLLCQPLWSIIEAGSLAHLCSNSREEEMEHGRAQAQCLKDCFYLRSIRKDLVTKPHSAWRATRKCGL